MKQNKFDEYQLINRYKIAYKTMFFLLFAIFVNGFISEEYMWASPLTQSYIIMMIGTGFFITMCIFKNAYISNKVKNKPLYISILIILCLFNTVLAVLPLHDLGISYFFKAENFKVT